VGSADGIMFGKISIDLFDESVYSLNEE